MRVIAALAAALALFPSAVLAVEGGAGASATAGTGGYRRLSLFADVFVPGGRVEPYGWAETSFATELRRFALGAGVWDNWTPDARGKAGLGIAGGRYDDERGASSLLAELGAEADVGASALGAEWRLTYGSLWSARDAPSLERASLSRSRGRRLRGEDVETFAVNELAAYGRTPTDAGLLGLRLAVELPPYGPSITSETVSLRVPLSDRLYATPAVTLEQGSTDAVYFSLGGYCRF
jgi:hypothetical protein